MKLPCARFARYVVSQGMHSWSCRIVGKRCCRTRSVDWRHHYKVEIGCKGRRANCFASLAEFSRMLPQGLEGLLSRRLWEGNRKQIIQALYNPFVVALAAGKLDKASFQSYISQDVFFLAAFSKAYKMALENTDDPDAASSIVSLQRAVDEELEMHSSYMQAWEFNSVSTSQVVPNAATSTYTNFLLETAAGRISGFVADTGESLEMRSLTCGKNIRLAAFTIAAMVPCMSLYAFLGNQLKSYVVGNAYRIWIETYSSDDFQNAASQIEHLLDNMASVCRDEDYDIIETLYQRAMNLEVAFFDAQPACESRLWAPFVATCPTSAGVQHQLTIMSDFDSTCTVADSCPVLVELTISSAQQEEQDDGKQLPLSSSDLRHQWNVLTELYAKEYSDLLDKVLATRQGTEDDYEGIRSALSKISEFEAQANKRVVDSKVLRGVELEKVRKAGTTMALRPGCQTFLERVRQESHVALYILSVCWSQSFVEGALRKGAEPLNIYCNELQVIGGVSDGNILRRVEHALDKDKVYDQILHDTAADLTSSTPNQPLVVYIGDSITDLLCLIKADLGIILGDSSALRRFSAEFGLDIRPLFSATFSRDKHFGNKKTVYEALDWHEVQTFLWGD